VSGHRQTGILSLRLGSFDGLQLKLGRLMLLLHHLSEIAGLQEEAASRYEVGNHCCCCSCYSIDKTAAPAALLIT